MRELIHWIGRLFVKADRCSAWTNYEEQRAFIKKQIHQIRIAATCEMIGATHTYPVRASGTIPQYGEINRAKMLFAVADDLERSLMSA